MAATCCVCHEALASSDNSYAAKCGHILHLPCWTEWLERSSNCPQCRQETSREELIRLFFNKSYQEDVKSLAEELRNFKATVAARREATKYQSPGSVYLGDTESDTETESDNSIAASENDCMETDSKSDESDCVIVLSSDEDISDEEHHSEVVLSSDDDVDESESDSDEIEEEQSDSDDFEESYSSILSRTTRNNVVTVVEESSSDYSDSDIDVVDSDSDPVDSDSDDSDD